MPNIYTDTQGNTYTTWDSSETNWESIDSSTVFTNFKFQFKQPPSKPKPKPIGLNPFEILELGSQPVSLQVATKQYRKLARKYHPDLPTGDAAKMKLINRAYDFIKEHYQK